VLVSIGGGSAAEDKKLLARYARLTGEDHRDEFAKKLAIYVTSHGFDGLDVDLEGPAITADYGPFIEVLSAALKAKGKLLTAAVARDYGGSHIPASALSRFDLVNIMAYDACGPWDPKSAGQPSSLDYAKENVNYWLGRGLDRKKAVLGVPFYGYGFGRAFRKSGYTYAAIVAAFPGAEKSDHAGETIWYNGIPLIQAKARYVREEKLAGLMIWSLDQDAGGDKSLLRTIHATLSSAAKTGDARAKTGN
jgi:GH18 family chitinase